MASRELGFKYSGAARANDPAWRVVIAPGRSRRAGAWIVAVAGASLCAAMASDAPAAVKALAGVLVLGEAIHAFRLHALRTANGAARRLMADLGGHVEVHRSDGSVVAGGLREGSFVAPWLIVARWIPDGARFARTIFLLPDMGGEQELRRLRVLLRWGDF